MISKSAKMKQKMIEIAKYQTKFNYFQKFSRKNLEYSKLPFIFAARIEIIQYWNLVKHLDRS